jgi:hypothetical protein
MDIIERNGVSATVIHRKRVTGDRAMSAVGRCDVWLVSGNLVSGGDVPVGLSPRYLAVQIPLWKGSIETSIFTALECVSARNTQKARVLRFLNLDGEALIKLKRPSPCASSRLPTPVFSEKPYL